ncbi:MAG: sigma-70 family RNA polymerase sigma factor [Planctomycetes bacterium]|nr:sigma-70 family RNA polymerase sigma factor [Planctomycetota bacterium]
MKRRDQTDMGGTQESFLTTHWSLLEGVSKYRDKDQAMIGLLLERYWKPVYCYLRRKGYPNEEAKDLTQEFFHEVVLNRRLLERADPAKGRFRSFLLHALDQFLIDQRRKEAAAKRIPRDKLVPFDIHDPPELPQTIYDRGPEECFAYTWKSELLDRTLSEVQAECEAQGLQTHWCLFRDKVLLPIREDRQSQPMKDICTRHGIADESTAFNMLLTVKRHFKAALRRNLRSTVLREEDIDDEWQEILSLLNERAQKAT